MDRICDIQEEIYPTEILDKELGKGNWIPISTRLDWVIKTGFPLKYIDETKDIIIGNDKSIIAYKVSNTWLVPDRIFNLCKMGVNNE